MDPLSLTASIMAVLGAGGSVASSIERIISLRNAPDAILALNNEISDFQLVVGMIQESLQDYESQDSADSTPYAENLESVLVRAREKLLELDMLIQYRLTTPGSQGGLNRIAWVLEQRKVKMIHDEIRSIRINLVAMIGALTSKAALRIELQVSAIRRMGDELRYQHRRSQDIIDQTVGYHSTLQNTLPTILETQERTEVQINELLANYAINQRVDSSQPEGNSTLQHLCITNEPINQIVVQIISIWKQHRSHCNSSCRCHCHRRHTLTSRQKWRSFFGLLFVGYVGLPVTSCDDIRCRQIRAAFVGLKYYFPWWFTSCVLEICVCFSKPHGLTQSLRVSRIVWGESKLFLAARSGDSLGLKVVLSSREGSPFDITDVVGDTALLVSNS